MKAIPGIHKQTDKLHTLKDIFVWIWLQNLKRGDCLRKVLKLAQESRDEATWETNRHTKMNHKLPGNRNSHRASCMLWMMRLFVSLCAFVSWQRWRRQQHLPRDETMQIGVKWEASSDLVQQHSVCHIGSESREFKKKKERDKSWTVIFNNISVQMIPEP